MDLMTRLYAGLMLAVIVWLMWGEEIKKIPGHLRARRERRQLPKLRCPRCGAKMTIEGIVAFCVNQECGEADYYGNYRYRAELTIRDHLMDGHPNPEGYLEWLAAQSDEKVVWIANSLRNHPDYKGGIP